MTVEDLAVVGLVAFLLALGLLVLGDRLLRPYTPEPRNVPQVNPQWTKDQEHRRTYEKARDVFNGYIEPDAPRIAIPAEPQVIDPHDPLSQFRSEADMTVEVFDERQNNAFWYDKPVKGRP